MSFWLIFSFSFGQQLETEILKGKKKKEQCENNLAKRSPIVSEFKACQARLLVLSSLYVKLLYIINT